MISSEDPIVKVDDYPAQRILCDGMVRVVIAVPEHVAVQLMVPLSVSRVLNHAVRLLEHATEDMELSAEENSDFNDCIEELRQLEPALDSITATTRGTLVRLNYKRT